jgi:hypothetical protein
MEKAGQKTERVEPDGAKARPPPLANLPDAHIITGKSPASQSPQTGARVYLKSADHVPGILIKVDQIMVVSPWLESGEVGECRSRRACVPD